MMPSMVKLPSSSISGGGGLARAPERSRRRATGTMVLLLEENNSNNNAFSSNLQGDCELHIEKDWGLNTHRGWLWPVLQVLQVISISYLVRKQSLFHCPGFCPSIRPQTKLTRGTSLETQTLQQVELVDNSSLTQL